MTRESPVLGYAASLYEESPIISRSATFWNSLSFYVYKMYIVPLFCF